MTRPLGGSAVAESLELVGPARGVAPLGGGETAIDAREAHFALRGRHRVVEDGAVDLVAVVAPQTLDALAGHGTSRERVVRLRREQRALLHVPGRAWQHEHGAGRVADHTPGDAADQHGVKRAVAAGAEHEQVEVLGRFDEDLGRVADGEERARRGARRRASPRPR